MNSNCNNNNDNNNKSINQVAVLIGRWGRRWRRRVHRLGWWRRWPALQFRWAAWEWRAGLHHRFHTATSSRTCGSLSNRSRPASLAGRPLLIAAFYTPQIRKYKDENQKIERQFKSLWKEKPIPAHVGCLMPTSKCAEIKQ